MTSHVLVTGAAGMLGRALCETFEPHFKLIKISKSGRENTLACDLSNLSATRKIFENQKINLVVNSAAYSDVDGCERDPEQAFRANTVIPKNLAMICSEKKIPWIHISTDYVFDGKKRSPYAETDPTGPVNIYGMTKWAGEFYALKSASPAVVVRTSWLFGAHEPKNFVNAIVERLRKEDEISVLDDQRDAPTYVKDLSLCVQKIAGHLFDFSKNNPDKAWNEIFHVCNTGDTTRHEMAVAIRDFMGLSKKKVHVTDRTQIKNRVAIRPDYVAMSNRRFQDFFKMKIRPWRESLSEYIKEQCAS